jgi:hypothetical protein
VTASRAHHRDSAPLASIPDVVNGTSDINDLSRGVRFWGRGGRSGRPPAGHVGDRAGQVDGSVPADASAPLFKLRRKFCGVRDVSLRAPFVFPSEIFGGGRGCFAVGLTVVFFGRDRGLLRVRERCLAFFFCERLRSLDRCGFYTVLRLTTVERVSLCKHA